MPRSTHDKQQLGVIELFKQFLPIIIRGLVSEIKRRHGVHSLVSYWLQDETRWGFRTETGHKITLSGVKPQQIKPWHYDYYYLYGLVEPVTGRSFFYEFSHFDSQSFAAYLEQFSQAYSQEIHIIQLDNAPVHTSHKLKVPSHVILLFQPPYCPELNPIERVWQHLKQQLKNLWFHNLEDLLS